MKLLRTAICLVAISAGLAGCAHKAAWRAGFARANVTPLEPIRMAGYSAREKPSDGVLSSLSAKAMAIQWDEGRPALLITADLINFRGPFAEDICARIARQTGLMRDEILLVPSHTHAGPVLGPEAATYGLVDEEKRAVERYSEKLVNQMVAIAAQALADLQPARLSWGVGKASFVMNRRQRSEKGVTIGVNREGYVDSAVPVLRIDSAEGRLRGMVFGCACHNTTMGGDNLKISGEYAGFAQEHLERDRPGAQAMFMIGCGGDANPYPRGTAELARQHGQTLAREVSRVMDGTLEPVQGPLHLAMNAVELPLMPMPSREELMQMQKGASYVQPNARRMLAMLERGETLPATYRAPVAVWQFGRGLTLVALPGETVSDYVPLVQAALGRERLWVSGYANDTFGYLPSRKVLAEGGYETRGLIFGTGFFAPEVEDAVLQAVRQTAAQVGRKAVH